MCIARGAYTTAYLRHPEPNRWAWAWVPTSAGFSALAPPQVCHMSYATCHTHTPSVLTPYAIRHIRPVCGVQRAECVSTSCKLLQVATRTSTKGLRAFAFAKKIGTADSPPPRCPAAPLPWVSWCGARRGCLARAIGPSGGPCPQSPTSPSQVIPKAQGNASRQLAGAVVLGAELRQRPHAAPEALLQFEYLRKTRSAQALRGCPGRPGRDG
jgi:hypothetical protein